MDINKKEQIKKNSEQSWANILLRYLNSKGCDYKIGEREIPAESVDVDIYAYSDSGKFKPLYLQLCLDVKPGNEGYEKISCTNKSYTFNNFGDTLGAVKGKKDKYIKQNKKFSHITMVVQTYYLTEDDGKYTIPKLTRECSQLGFEAIYILSPGEPEYVFKIC